MLGSNQFTPQKPLPFVSSTPVTIPITSIDMSEVSNLVIRTPGPARTPNRPRGRAGSAASAFSQKSREREAEILTQRISSRLVDLEKDGAEVIKDLGKLRTQVEESLEDARLAVGELGTMEDPRKGFQEMSQRLMEVEDDIALLAASMAQWQNSSTNSSGEFNVTSNVDESGRYLVTEPTGPWGLELEGDELKNKPEKNVSECQLGNKTDAGNCNVSVEEHKEEGVSTTEKNNKTSYENGSARTSKSTGKSLPNSNSFISSIENRPSSGVLKASTPSPIPGSILHHSESELFVDDIHIDVNMSNISPIDEKLEHLFKDSDKINISDKCPIVKGCSYLSNDKAGTSNNKLVIMAQDKEAFIQDQLNFGNLLSNTVNAACDVRDILSNNDNTSWLCKDDKVSSDILILIPSSPVEDPRLASSPANITVRDTPSPDYLPVSEIPLQPKGTVQSQPMCDSTCVRSQPSSENISPVSPVLVEKIGVGLERHDSIHATPTLNTSVPCVMQNNNCESSSSDLIQFDDDESENMYMLKDLPTIEKPIFEEWKIREEKIHFNRELEKNQKKNDTSLDYDQTKQSNLENNHLKQEIRQDYQQTKSLVSNLKMKINKEMNTNLAETSLERHRITTIENIGKELHNLESGNVGLFTFMEGCPSLFWIYIESRGLTKLQDYLDARYGQGEGDGGGDGLTIGSPVLAKYSLDGRYFRARVEEVVVVEDNPSDSMYSVCFMDYGNSEVVSGRELIVWDRRLEALPEQAVSCCLADGPRQWREGGRDSWTPDELHLFQQILRKGELKVELTTDLRQKEDPTKPMFEVIVWLDDISLMEILRRHPVFAKDLANYEPAINFNQGKKICQVIPLRRSFVPVTKVTEIPMVCSQSQFDNQPKSSIPTLSPFIPTAKNTSTSRISTPRALRADNSDWILPNANEDMSVSLVNQVLIKNAEAKVNDWLDKKCQETSDVIHPPTPLGYQGNSASIQSELDRPEPKREQSEAISTIHNVGTLQILVDGNSCFDFLLSTMDNAGMFFIHPVQDETSRLDDIHSEILSHTLATPEERKLVPGTVWTILDEVQNNWCRVRIERSDISGVSIRFIDYGGIQHNIKFDMLRELPNSSWVSQLPGLAVRCHLAGCSPTGGNWDPTSTTLLEEYLGYESQQRAMVIGEEGGSMGVVLLFKDIVVNQKMVEWGFAQSNFMDSFGEMVNILTDSGEHDLKRDWNPMEEAFVAAENNYGMNQEDVETATTGYRSKDMVCPLFELKGECWRGQFCEMRHVYTARPAVTNDREDVAIETIMELNLPCPGRTVYVKIPEIESPGLFYCVLAMGTADMKSLNTQGMEAQVTRGVDSGQETLNNFMEQMQIFYKSKQRTDFTAVPALGELVACRNPLNNLWCRGRVTANNIQEDEDDKDNNEDEGKAYVFFADYGHTDLVEVSQMRRLDICFTVFPLQAVECWLAGVKPVGDTWSEETKEEFKRLVQEHWIMAQVVACDAGRMLLDLFIPGDPGNDINVAEELIKLGLAKTEEFLPQNTQELVKTMPG